MFPDLPHLLLLFCCKLKNKNWGSPENKANISVLSITMDKINSRSCQGPMHPSSNPISPLRFGSGSQSCVLQDSCWDAQLLPPHILTLNRVPLPQDFVHSLHVDHSPVLGLAACMCVGGKSLYFIIQQFSWSQFQVKPQLLYMMACLKHECSHGRNLMSHMALCVYHLLGS